MAESGECTDENFVQNALTKLANMLYGVRDEPVAREEINRVILEADGHKAIIGVLKKYSGKPEIESEAIGALMNLSSRE